MPRNPRKGRGRRPDKQLNTGKLERRLHQEYAAANKPAKPAEPQPDDGLAEWERKLLSKVGYRGD